MSSVFFRLRITCLKECHFLEAKYLGLIRQALLQMKGDLLKFGLLCLKKLLRISLWKVVAN